MIVLIFGSLVFFVLTAIIVYILLFHQKRRYQHQEQLMQVEKTYAEALLESKLEIQEQTFKNISQEIHDNIGQVLSFIKLNLNTLNLHGNETDDEKLQQSKNLLTQAIRDLRDIAKTLNTDFIKDTGILDAIEYQLVLLRKSGQYETEFLIEGIPYRLDVQKELVVFRVVQELLNNIVKHAEASWIRVEIRYQADNVIIQVRDNGKGFDLPDIESMQGLHNGLGLRNMLNRVALIHGLISINSIPGDGTRSLIELPKLE